MNVSDMMRLDDLASCAVDAELRGRPLLVVDLENADWGISDAAIAALTGLTGVVVGISAKPLPDRAAPLLEALTLTLAPGGPGRTWAGSPDDLDAIRSTASHSPYAAVTLAGTLRATSTLPVTDGLVVESLAYSMLLGSQEFLTWRARTRRKDVPPAEDPVLLERRGDTLYVALNRPDRHNAFVRGVRDGLVEALALAELDTSVRHVHLSGRGRSFCSGGDLDEFGTATDVAAAHLVRLQQSAALAVHRIADRVVCELHGACIGAGIEVPSFAGRIEARDGSWFRLPELSMGLIPGAGGTVGIPRRIGPWRTAYLALTGARLDLETALAWGLVDARV